jgi:hypothetical protein
MPPTMLSSCIHFGSTCRPSASRSSRRSNMVLCKSNGAPHEQACTDANTAHLQPGFLHFLLFGSWSCVECLHRHFKSYEPTKRD